MIGDPIVAVLNSWTPSGDLESMALTMSQLGIMFTQRAAHIARLSFPRDPREMQLRHIQVLSGIGAQLLAGEVDGLFWREDMWRSAITGHEGFAGQPLAPHHLVTRPQLWYFERDLELAGAAGAPAWWSPVWTLNSAALFPVPDPAGQPWGMLTVLIFLRAENSLFSEEHGLPRVIVSGGWQPGTPVDPGQTMQVAAIEYLRHPCVALDERPPGNHGFRKAFKRARLAIPRTSVIVLRRPERRGGGPEKPGAASRDWRVRWWVGGHHRHFDHELRSGPYAGSRSTYVFPYVKNIDREDLPLNPPRGRLYDVRR